jgi:hypothetical protein
LLTKYAEQATAKNSMAVYIASEVFSWMAAVDSKRFASSGAHAKCTPEE